MKYFIRNIILVFTALVFFIRCGDKIVEPPPYIPIEILKTAPDSLFIEDKVIKLSTYMSVDMMPSTDPSPVRNYMTIAYIATADSTECPSSIEADDIYIIHNNEVSSSFLKDDEYLQDEFRIVKNAKVDAKWGYDIYTDVVVSISYGNNKYLLSASHQFIGAVW